MPLPGDITTITVTGTYEDASGTALVGTVTFTPSTDLTDSTGHVILRAASLAVTLTSGSFSIVLPCTDDATLNPAGWYWVVRESVGTATMNLPTRSYNVLLPHGLGSTVDLSSLAPAVAGTAVSNLYGVLAAPNINVWASNQIFSGTTAVNGGLSINGTAIANPPGGTTLFLRADGTWATAGGAGAVTSVNGHVGVVVLGASDVSAVPEALATTKGDLAAASGSAVFARLGVGSDNQALVADSTQATGLNWRFGLYPWQFDVRTYGAKGDGKAVSDAAMTASSNVLICATTTPFTSTAVDGGKIVIVRNGAGAGIPLVTTINTITDSSHAVLTANATNTVTNSIAVFASDDTVAFQNAFNAANTYIGTHAAGMAEVGGPPAIYGIGGALQTGAPFHGNGQIMIGAPVSTAGLKSNLWLKCWGVDNVGGSGHWLQTIPQASGMVLLSTGVFASTGAQGTSANNNGNPSVIGGPAQPAGYGTSGAVFSNMHFGMKGVSIVTPYSSNGLNYCGIDLSGIGQASLKGCIFTVTGTFDLGDFNAPAGFGTGISKAFLLPANGNNDFTSVEDVVVYGGYNYGLWFTEHTEPRHCVALYCNSGVNIVASYFSSVGAVHGYDIGQINVESCANNVQIVGQASAGVGPFVDIGQLDTEAAAPTFVDDSSGLALAAALGTVKLVGQFTPANITIGNTTLNIINGQQKSGPVTLALTINTAKQNIFWRWATVILTGGTVTSVQVGNTMGGTVAPAMTTVWSGSGSLTGLTVRVPPGGWLQVNGTVIPTVGCVLD